MTARDVLLTCPLDCPDACRLKVTLEGGKATKITGDPDHPITRGFACAKTVYYPLRQYHPDRPLHPLKKVDGAFVQISWDQALDEIAARLERILKTSGPQAILRYNYAGTMGLREGSHVHSFFRALGACELEETICATAGSEAWSQSYGPSRLAPDPLDLVHNRLILLWGINSLATHSHLTPMLKEARKRGARIIHIDPYQNKTSLFADQHLKIRPGTDAALALGMMNYIFEHNLHDADYLERACAGAAELQESARGWDLTRTAEVTGLTLEEVRDLAHAYGTTSPSFIRVGYGMTRHEWGGNNLRAVTLLPALRGQWAHLGGGAMLSSSGAFKLNRTQLGAAHLIQPQTKRVNMNRLGEALLEEKNPLEALFVYNCNPLAVSPDTVQVAKGFARSDLLTVVLEQAMTETAQAADYVLPATTFLEHEDVYTAYGHHYLGHNPATLEPLGEAKPNSWIFAELGRRLGITEPTLYWTFDELLEHLLDSDHPWLGGITPTRLKAEGTLRLNLPERFLPYANGASNGKIQLSPAPQYQGPQDQTSSEYPFRLLTPPAHHFLNSTYGNLERLNHAQGGEPVALIHPLDAQEHGLLEGEYATLGSKQGQTIRKVKFLSEMARGTVVVEGTWWGNLAPDGQGINVLTSQRLTDLGGGSTFHNTPIWIRQDGRA